MFSQVIFIGGEAVAGDDNSLFSWGRNNNGQLGRPGGVNTPAEIFDDAVFDIECGFDGSAIIRADGTLWKTGFWVNTYGDGATNNATSFTQVGSITNWVKLGGKRSTYHLIRADGGLYGHGENSNLELGNGGSTDTTTISFIDAGPWVDVMADSRGGVGIKADGTLWAWGRGTGGFFGLAVGDGAGVDRSSPVQIGAATDWIKVKMGFHARFALNSLGQLFSWGGQLAGELGLGLGTGTGTAATPTLIGSGYADVDAGSFSVCAVKTDGTLHEWGFTPRPAPVFIDAPSQIGTDTDWASVSVAMHTQTVGQWLAGALKTNNKLFMWGYNAEEQTANTDTGTPQDVLPVKKGIENFTWNKISAGTRHTIALTKKENPP